MSESPRNECRSGYRAARLSGFTALCLLFSVTGFVGCRQSPPPPAVGAVIEVTAVYPGANAPVVVYTIAIPFEHFLQGVEGVVRLESESNNSGRCVARLYFGPGTDVTAARELVQNRVDQIELPQLIKREGISVTVGRLADGPKQIVLAVVDKSSEGWDALDAASETVREHLAAEAVIVAPRKDPLPAKVVSLDIDWKKCRKLDISHEDLFKAFQQTGEAYTYRLANGQGAWG